MYMYYLTLQRNLKLSLQVHVLQFFLHGCVKHGLRLEALESRRTHSMQHSVFEGLQIVHVPASSLSSSGHDNGFCNRQPQLSFQGSRVCVAAL